MPVYCDKYFITYCFLYKIVYCIKISQFNDKFVTVWLGKKLQQLLHRVIHRDCGKFWLIFMANHCYSSFDGN